MTQKGRLNIAICGTQVPFIRGGAEKLVQTLAMKLAERGHQVDTVMLPFKWYPREKILSSALAWKLLDLTESSHTPIDLVIATKFPSYFVQHPNKVVWLVHQHRASFDHYETPYSPFQNTIEDNSLREEITQYERVALEEAKALFAISRNVANRLKKYLGLTAEALYPPLYHPDKYCTKKADNYILSVSRLEEDKRVNILIEALAHPKARKVRAKIVGTGSQIENLKNQAKEQGIADRVDFLGFVDDEHLYELYAGALAVFFAPWDEDYGYITIEAFQSQKPVITSRESGGVLEFVEDGKDGIVTDGSPEDVAQAIGYILKNKKARDRMGKDGFSKVQSITWEHTIERLLSTCS